MTDSNSTDDGSERTDAEARDESRPRERETGFRLEIGLGPITDLLGGLVDVDVSRLEEGERRHPAERGERHGVSRRPSSPADEAEPAASGDYHVQTYRSEGELTVVADLPGVDEDDLLVGLDERSNDLVVAVHDRVVERISLPWSDVVVPRVRFNNGVLDVCIRPATGDDAPEDE
ncbi:gas vesicle protein GvpH [Halomarina pelagica]|uniref:gas vesicle protein GvpH n=1 Tax=Halomarina pelagica TaxID=2961599 RepID=UPI0020C50B14|nr:gas vesicle protein GvpH [Halomarina sp. BND7]